MPENWNILILWHIGTPYCELNFQPVVSWSHVLLQSAYVAGFFSVYSKNFFLSTPEQLKTEVIPALEVKFRMSFKKNEEKSVPAPHPWLVL